jgi:hypothetical protein
VVEAVADGAHGRAGTDHRSTNGAEDQEEAEVAATGQEAAALILAAFILLLFMKNGTIQVQKAV